MATKKKSKGKKKAAKKTAAKKTTAKKDRKSRVKKDKVPYTPNESRIVYFMNSLIQAGYVGKTIPEDNKEKRVASQNLRQMAQQLDRQVHKTVA